jgi:hypothetical protein
MPDTGAPWNLPYPSPSDLVRDAPQAFEDLAVATAAGLDDAGSEGIGPNVVQAVKTDTQVTSLSSGATAQISGLTCTITPSSNTSKVLVLVSLSLASDGAGTNLSWILERDGVAISVGDADGSRTRVTSGAGAGGGMNAVAGVVLDSPNTASPVDYTVRVQNNRDTTRPFNVNRNEDDSNLSRIPRAASRITAVEVKA